MAATPFAQLTIAARGDLESTLASLDLIAQEGDESTQDVRIQNAYNDAKSELLSDLVQVAPDIYAYSKTLYAGYGLTDGWMDWFFAMGYNWNTIDGLMDAIFNPAVLKDTLVACWKWKLYSIQAEDMLSSGADAMKPYVSMRDYWEGLYHTRYDKAYRQLQFDLNKDGVIQPGERIRTRTSIRLR